MSSGSTYSQSTSNFSDSMRGGVDQRTGTYTAALVIAHLKANGGAGPSLPLSLNYDPSNTLDTGFGIGWGMAWPRYEEANGTVVFAAGDKYQSRALGDEIQLVDQKIVNAKASNCNADLSSQGYQFQQRQGEIYVLDQFTRYGHWVPSRIIGAHGLGITLAWNDVGQLLSITDEVPDDTGQCPVLVRFDYDDGAGATITLWPDTDVERQLKLSCADGYLQSVQMADLQWNMTYDYTIQSFGKFPLSELEYPTGSKETVFYVSDGNGHKYPPCASRGNATVSYVTRYKKQVNGVKTDRIITYKFSEKNYLGYNSEMSEWKHDKDNLYDVEDSYTYSSVATRTDDDGTEVVTTNVYNKFHLLVTQTTKKNSNTSITTHTYDIESGGFRAQPAHFQSPIKTEATYIDATGRHSQTTTNEYDENANKIRTVHPDGTVETWEYYPANGSDPDCPAASLGVKTYLKSRTVTPPVRPKAPSAPIQKTVHKYSTIYWDESQTRYGIVSVRSEGYADDVLITSSDLEYNFSPKSYFHGMVKSHVDTVYDEQQKGYPTGHSMEYAVRDGKITVTTTIKSYDNLSKQNVVTSCAYTGSALQRRNTLGNLETHTYDQIGRVTSHTICADDPLYAHTKTYAYGLETLDDNKSYRTVTTTDPQKVVSKQFMNGEGKLLSETTKVDDFEQKLLERSFDNRGRLTTITMMDYLGPDGISLESGDITPIEQSDSVVADVRTLSYDDWEQQDQYTLQSGGEVLQKYNPINIRTVERIGQEGTNGSRLTLFDDAYHPHKVQMVDGQGYIKAEETMVLDGAARLCSHTNALGQTTQFVYDRFNRLTEKTYPDGMIETRTYFPHSRSKEVASIAVNGIVIASQTMDGFGRIRERTVGGRKYTFTYQNDAASKPSMVSLPDMKFFSYERIAQLGEVPRKVTTKDGSYRAFEYDPLTAHPIKITQSTPGGDKDALVVTLTYTPRGEVKTRTVSNLIDNTTRLFTYEYSIGGALLSYTDPYGTTNITYDPFGRKASIKNARTKTTFSYGPNNLLSGWKTEGEGNTNSVNIEYDEFNRVVSRSFTETQTNISVSIDIEYDLINRISKKTINNISTGTQQIETYTYDNGGRLSSVTYSGEGGPCNSSGAPLDSITYRYDSFGNLIQKSESPGSAVLYSYKNKLDPYQLTSVSTGEILSYDRAGRLCDAGSGTYTYDSFGQIAHYVSSNSDVATYQYDGNGTLRSQTVNKNKKREFYYLQGKVVSEILTSGDKVTRIARTYHQEYPLAQYSDSDPVALFGSDHGGSVLTVSKDGQTKSTLYFPFGEQTESPGEYLPSYDGEIADSLSGHYHLGQGYRVYIPSLKHFNKPDSASPFGLGGLNWYSYVANDPINHADPTGHYVTQKTAGASSGSIMKASAIGLGMIGAAAHFGQPLIEGAFAAEATTMDMALGGLGILGIVGAVAAAALFIAAQVERPKHPQLAANLQDWAIGIGMLSVGLEFGTGKYFGPKPAEELEGEAESDAAEASGKKRKVKRPALKKAAKASKAASAPETAQGGAKTYNVTQYYFNGVSKTSEELESIVQNSDKIKQNFTRVSARLGDAEETAIKETSKDGSASVSPTPKSEASDSSSGNFSGDSETTSLISSSNRASVATQAGDSEKSSGLANWRTSDEQQTMVDRFAPASSAGGDSPTYNISAYRSKALD